MSVRTYAVMLVILAGSTLCAADQLRVACIGDSITVGFGVDASQRYPAQLQTMLGAEWKVGNFGYNGATIASKGNPSYVAQTVWREARDFQPQIAVIMMGGNDAKPSNVVHADTIATDLTTMIQELQALPSHPAIILCLPCSVVDPGNYGVNEERIAQSILPPITSVAQALHLPLVDIHALTRAAVLADPSLMPDRVHPNAEGCRLLAETVKAAVLNIKPSAGN